MLGQQLTTLALLLLGGSSFAHTPAWKEEKGFRWRPIETPSSGLTRFALLPSSQTGILWTNLITPEQVARNYNVVSGAGVAAGDFDADGWCDLFFCNRGGPDALFRNLGGGRFQNVTAMSGLATASRADSSSVGAAFADLNGDRLLDLVITSFRGPNRCYINSGGGKFIDQAATARLNSRGGATSLAFGDVDGDDDLDLYIACFGAEAILREGGRLSFQMVNGQPVVTGRHGRRIKVAAGQLVELGEEDVLYLNDGTGKFKPAAWADFFEDEDGRPISSAPLDFGLAVQIRDINDDGLPDIYVCNDFQTPDRAWLNTGTGKFRAMPAVALRSMSYASMGVDFADIDRDGRLDFITVEMLARDHTARLRQLDSMPPLERRPGRFIEREPVGRNALFWNRGDGTYADIAWLSGLAASDWSWTPVFLDADLDGYEDLLISTGTLYDVMDRDAADAARTAPGRPAEARKLLALYPSLESRNAAFRNRGDLTFEDVTEEWNFGAREISYGMALADFDNDGDSDLAINCANAAPLIYRNDAPEPRVAVTLKGQPPNTWGIGAKITLLAGAVREQKQEMIAGGRYLSGDQPMRVFATGKNPGAMSIEVTWPGGKHSRIGGVQANRIYEIAEPE